MMLYKGVNTGFLFLLLLSPDILIPSHFGELIQSTSGQQTTTKNSFLSLCFGYNKYLRATVYPHFIGVVKGRDTVFSALRKNNRAFL